MKIIPQRVHYIIHNGNVTTEKETIEWNTVKEAWKINKPMVIFWFYSITVLFIFGILLILRALSIY
jgi:hypothetical protein